MKDFLLERTVFLRHTAVGQGNGNSLVQISQFSHTGLQDAVLVLSNRKNASIGQKV